MPMGASDHYNYGEADLLKEWAREVREQARTIRTRARAAQREARLAREQRGWARSSQAMPPPLDYRLRPLSLVKAAVTRRPPLLASRTMIYLWGRGQPRGSIAQLPFNDSETARRFAAQRGYAAWGPDTWAWEIELPLGLSEVLEEFGPVLRRDPAVTGWALRTVRAAPLP